MPGWLHAPVPAWPGWRQLYELGCLLSIIYLGELRLHARMHAKCYAAGACQCVMHARMQWVQWGWWLDAVAMPAACLGELRVCKLRSGAVDRRGL